MAENYEFRAVSVLIMATNETDLLEQTVQGVFASCSADDIEEIIIVLKSADCPSAEQAKKMIAADKTGKLSSHVQKGPKTSECFFEMPQLAHGSHFVFMAADMEMDPHSIGDFVREAKAHPGRIICASKWVKGSTREGYSQVRRIFSRTLNRIITLLYGVKATDLISFFQIYPVALYKSMNFRSVSRFFYEYTLKPLRLGAEYAEVPTTCRKKKDRRSSFSSVLQIGVAMRYILVAVIFRLTPKRWLNGRH